MVVKSGAPGFRGGRIIMNNDVLDVLALNSVLYVNGVRCFHYILVRLPLISRHDEASTCIYGTHELYLIGTWGFFYIPTYTLKIYRRLLAYC